jgi:hypothetical protein
MLEGEKDIVGSHLPAVHQAAGLVVGVERPTDALADLVYDGTHVVRRVSRPFDARGDIACLEAKKVAVGVCPVGFPGAEATGRSFCPIALERLLTSEIDDVAHHGAYRVPVGRVSRLSEVDGAAVLGSFGGGFGGCDRLSRGGCRGGRLRCCGRARGRGFASA